jgi:hypothetical protein
MPDLAWYRAKFPELSEEQAQKLQWQISGLAREIVMRFEGEQQAAEGDRLRVVRSK